MRRSLLSVLSVWTLSVAAPDIGMLGKPCHPSGRCVTRLSVCVDNVCVCQPNLIMNKWGSRCLPVVTKMGEACEENAQCAPRHSVCRNRECVCAEGYVVADDDRGCVPERGLHEPCETSRQCAQLTECDGRRRVCVCAGISYEYHGGCVTDHGGAPWVITDVTVAPNRAVTFSSTTIVASFLAVSVMACR